MWLLVITGLWGAVGGREFPVNGWVVSPLVNQVHNMVQMLESQVAAVSRRTFLLSPGTADIF